MKCGENAGSRQKVIVTVSGLFGFFLDLEYPAALRQLLVWQMGLGKLTETS